VGVKLTVFISGTMKELPEKRSQVAETINSMGLEAVWAELAGARNRSPHDECEEMARTCDIYLGLYGLRYGWKIPPEEVISATEFEWQTACDAVRPMLIYHQIGTADTEQGKFIDKVRAWQNGRFTYTYTDLDDLIPHLRDDLSTLIKQAFRPIGPGDDLERQVIMCLEGLAYKVSRNAGIQGVQVPIVAEYHNALVLPQCLAVGCQPKHTQNLAIATTLDRFSGVVYVTHGDVPAEVLQSKRIQCVSFDDLLNIAGPGRAEAQLRRAAWEWRELGAKKLLTYEDFERISEYRRQIAGRLHGFDLAYALRCSLLHGKNLPFWTRANRDNEPAVDAIIQPMTENCGRRPLLRAGYALERIAPELRATILARGRAVVPMTEMLKSVLDAAEAGRTTDAWTSELKYSLDAGLMALMFQQIKEPDR
jgi:hypothetical protein